MPGLRHVDPLRPRGRVSRIYARITATRLGRRPSRHVVWRLDPLVLRLTRGRLGLGLFLPTALLETRGARSGVMRRNAVIYFHDGEDAVVVASKLGLPSHPAWYHNLRAHPHVRLGGVPMRASVVTGEAERERLWALADNVFAPFADYRRDARRAGRTIPLVVLSPSAGDGAAGLSAPAASAPRSPS